jgi:hypothetical protein
MNGDLPPKPASGPVPASDLENQMMSADLIVAGKITRVSDSSQPVALVSQQAGPAHDQVREAEVAAVRTVAGKHDGGLLRVFFLAGKVPSRPWMQLSTGETVLLFLRRINEAYVPYAPEGDLVHTLSNIAPPAAGASRREALASDLEQTILIADPNSQLNVIVEASVARARLREAINLQLLDTPALRDPVRRAAWVAIALAQGQVQVVGELPKLFENPPPPPANVLWSLVAQRLGELSAQVAPSQLAALLQSVNQELSRAAAVALRQLHNSAAVPYLIDALNHPDQNIRYQAIMGLAELEPGVGPGPAYGLYQSHESEYIERWRRWWESSGRRQSR